MHDIAERRQLDDQDVQWAASPIFASGFTLSFDKDPTPEEVEQIRKEEAAKQAERKRQLEDEELAKLQAKKATG